MGWLERFLGAPGTSEKDEGSETVRKIARELDSLPLERARYVAAFAFVLGRVAYADQEVSPEETRAMEEIVREIGGVPENQAVLAVEIAKAQHKLFSGTDNFIVTREFQASATEEDRQRLLDALFAVSAADDSISSEEEATIRTIASELGYTRAQFVEARSQWSDKRSVMQRYRRRRSE